MKVENKNYILNLMNNEKEVYENKIKELQSEINFCKDQQEINGKNYSQQINEALYSINYFNEHINRLMEVKEDLKKYL